MIEIRRLQPTDRSDWEALFRAYMRFYGRDEAQSLYDRAWREFSSDVRMHARVAWLDGSLVGIVHFLMHANTSSADVCYLQDLFTVEHARGRGVGRALIGAVADVARAQGCARVYWMTQETNTVARRLYDTLGEYRGFIRYQIDLTARNPAAMG